MGETYWADDYSRLMHVVVISIFGILSCIAVAFRLWARKIQRAKIELSDCLCIVGLVFSLGLSLFTIHSQIYWDLGGDPTQLGNPSAIMKLVILEIKAVIVGEVLWIVSIAALRASILCLYSHLFRMKTFRHVCYAVHVINFIYFASTILGACLICRPIAAAWNPAAGTCGKQKSLDMFIGIFNLVIDIFVVVLPMPVVWGLQMSTKKKILLSGIFGMGVIICVITLTRIIITATITATNSQQIYSIIALLTCLEASLGVVNTCLPVMRPVFTKLHQTPLWTALSTTTKRTFHRAATATTHLRSSSIPTTSKSHHRNNNNLTPPRFIEPKAGKILFPPPHHHTGVSSAAAGSKAPPPPRPPPKSKYYSPEKPRWEEKETENGVEMEMEMEKRGGTAILVQREWDVERGGSSDSDRIPLK